MKVLSRAYHHSKRTPDRRKHRQATCDFSDRPANTRPVPARQHPSPVLPTIPRPQGGSPEPLAVTFGHPQGTGFIGPGGRGLLRAALTEALLSRTGVSWAIATQADLHRLFGDTFDKRVFDRLSPRLQVVDTLEDAVERMEFEADVINAINVSGPPAAQRPPVLWLTSSGPDADVVHQALQKWSGTNLVVLVDGGWPYGPTHLIESDGSSPMPRHPVDLMTPHQAIAALRSLHV
ncbi:hypothetical protein Acsp04_66140 [Actinomadura sp. NBRC 104425]|uniref:hypothetical protein n=1 Tax=Actinomadura sp. NBRC 104425 TaxID=3032204 RepID=UPI0024A07151|nr:hypothetical protein [Actinomadura sp. NBRC 104425]GLZ16379.1 hypothetical protein Acsp04_66140 [Actinomadura sp. NBRC 104425]